MNQTTIWRFASALALILFTGAGELHATPPNGFVATTIAKGTFGDLDVLNTYLYPNNAQWFSLQRTSGLSDLYVQSNVWNVGGTTGWHTHPGHSLVIVTAGEVTDYEVDGDVCTRHTYTAGMTFVDEGGPNHTHMVRNEGKEVAQAIAVQLIPSTTNRRIDKPAPASCEIPDRR